MPHLIRDVHTRRVPKAVLLSPGLGAFLQTQTAGISTLYKGIVAKRTGRLAESTKQVVEVGGHKRDRLIGKVVIGTGVNYGVLHEVGAPRNPDRRGAHELARAAAMWKASKK